MKTPIAIITGGSRGLGKSAAIKLVKAGVDVVVTHQTRRADADATVPRIQALGGKAVALKLDTAAPRTFGGFVETVKDTLDSE
jgi:NAD(P)-dependent dehydrogenase (short-subunit alcohol dehydrogenase family)